MCNRADALVALARVGDRAAVPAMIKRLKDRHWAVRCEAAPALGAMRDHRAVPALRRSLADRNPSVRYYVATALSDLGADEAKGQLEALYRRRIPSDRVAAAGALYTLTLEQLYLEELGRLLREAPHWGDRIAAQQTLEWVMRPRDLPKVRQWVRSALRTEMDSEGLRKDLRRLLKRR